MSQVEADPASRDVVESDETVENGLLLGEKYLPEELLAEILFHVDFKTLLECQVVCKRWYSILQNYVWRKKAESTAGISLHYGKETPWYLYYAICSEKLSDRNLVKNHSGKNGAKKHWKVTQNGGNKWKVECPPQGVPALPISEPVFEGRQYCFVSSYGYCCKQQTIDLVAEGVFVKILDVVQPPITISEWYSCRWDCSAIYECGADLIGEDEAVLDSFHFEHILEGENQNTWHCVKHEFVNYGPGVRKVMFWHRGKDKSFWAGHYGAKMAGTCIRINLPKQTFPENREASDTVPDSD